jgi:hypothetical protein
MQERDDADVVGGTGGSLDLHHKPSTIVPPVGIRCYPDSVPVRKLSVALEETVAARAAEAAQRRGVSLSAWLNAAAERALVLEQGLAGVAEWEVEHGELSAEELAWADSVLDRSAADRAAS